MSCTSHKSPKCNIKSFFWNHILTKTHYYWNNISFVTVFDTLIIYIKRNKYSWIELLWANPTHLESPSDHFLHAMNGLCLDYCNVQNLTGKFLPYLLSLMLLISLLHVILTSNVCISWHKLNRTTMGIFQM